MQEISARSPLGELSKIMNPSNPASIYQMQIENGVGKATIGVAATGIKAFYNLTGLFIGTLPASWDRR